MRINDTEKARDYEIVERAILFLEKNFRLQPTLQEIARHVHLSEFHFQRLFQRWAGVSPKKFIQFLSKEHAKSLLQDSESILNTAYDTGLSGSSRLHDLFVTHEGVTPGEYKTLGKGLDIIHGRCLTIFGMCYLAMTDRGVCEIHFECSNFVEYLHARWSAANLIENNDEVKLVIDKIFSGEGSIHLLLRGTNFQVKIWEALLRIPSGKVVCYSDIAKYIGNEKAVRAVGSAIAKNPIAFLIPCHRVIRKLGHFNDYRWGKVRKKAILGWEMVQD
ncbi:bifunctional transcriptional activator/DNA repair enzyme AdaA [Candidatus Uabimicrobium sp. HlEnr_7]|uniref:bifunctional transcriptional activator/DNA repair enzyme AdaA n=1 Tax=Candidatus Uabimicrobium helgolandensis TaxID=3095367 RepID=UPI0035576287